MKKRSLFVISHPNWKSCKTTPNALINPSAIMNSRKNRLPEIVDIITHEAVSSQEELSKKLAVRGHIITQATLSRDLKLLKATKISDERGGYRYVLGELDSCTGQRGATRNAYPTSSGRTYVLSLRITGNLVVIKTRNGYASGLAYDIDTLESDLVLGTIPGADTVFVAVREGISRTDLFNLFSSFLPAQIMNDARASFLGE